MALIRSFLVLATVVLFTGCTDTPDKTTQDMYDAMQKGNLSKLIKNTTDPISGAIAARALRECSVDKKSYTDELKLVEDCMLELYSNLSVKSIKLIKEDGSSALIEAEIKNNATQSKVKLNLIKIDNKWKVAGTE